jgi:hypothetical protein
MPLRGCLGVSNKDVRCIESAGRKDVNTVPPAGFLNHGHGAPALAHK